MADEAEPCGVDARLRREPVEPAPQVGDGLLRVGARGRELFEERARPLAAAVARRVHEQRHDAALRECERLRTEAVAAAEAPVLEHEARRGELASRA